jgi:hypothetical protein
MRFLEVMMMKIKNINESELFNPVIKLFQKKTSIIVKEVPFYRKSIDIIILDKKTKQIIAIELKVNKWKKALRQAFVYQMCSNKVFVALWHKHVNAECINTFNKYGIGLIEVYKLEKELKSKFILFPKTNAIIKNAYLKEMRQTINNGLKRKNL